MKNSKSSLFLMELIISIFFFSLASAVCIQLFVKAHLIGENTIQQNNCALWSQNVAEAFYGSDDKVSFSKLFPFSSVNGNDFTLYFDKNWNMLTEYSSDVIYTVTATLTNDNQYRYADITINSLTHSTTPQNLLSVPDSSLTDINYTPKSDTTKLYSLSIKTHIPERSVASNE